MSIKITGTSHILPISEKDTFEFIALELDEHRFFALTHKLKSHFSWQNAKIIGLGGYLFAYFGGIIQNYLAKKLGVAPGEDMLSAIKLAQKTKAKLILIDQPIQITLRRFSKNISVFEKIKFVMFLLTSAIFSREKIDLKRVPSEQMVERLTTQLKLSFPGIYKILVSERDDYMASKLTALQQIHPNAKILAIIGAGHLSGLKRKLAKYIN